MLRLAYITVHEAESTRPISVQVACGMPEHVYYGGAVIG
jgi:hypothetical protein